MHRSTPPTPDPHISKSLMPFTAGGRLTLGRVKDE